MYFLTYSQNLEEEKEKKKADRAGRQFWISIDTALAGMIREGIQLPRTTAPFIEK